MSKYGIKELYQGMLKATTPIEIFGKVYNPNETILLFDNIQSINFNENNSIVNATGGWNNIPLVTWNITNEITGQLNVGIVSKKEYGIMNNTKLQSAAPPMLINQIEEHSCNGMQITVFHPIDTNNPVKVFKIIENNLEEILDFTIQDSTIKLEEEIYDNILVDYWFQYQSTSELIEIGRKDINGYLMFTGKFYYVDEFTGVRKTGLIEIPRFSIEGNFSIRLGRNANPFISTLNFKGIPSRERRDGVAVKISYLDEDLDAEI